MELDDAITQCRTARKTYEAFALVEDILVQAKKAERWTKEADQRLEKRQAEVESVNTMIARKRDELSTIESQNREHKARLKADFDQKAAEAKVAHDETVAGYKAEEKALNAKLVSLRKSVAEVRDETKKVLDAHEASIKEKKQALNDELAKRKEFQKEQMDAIQREVASEEARLKSVRGDIEKLQQTLSGSGG